MPRNSNSKVALPSDADGIDYVPGTRIYWSDPKPQTIQRALDDTAVTIGVMELHVPLIAEAAGFAI